LSKVEEGTKKSVVLEDFKFHQGDPSLILCYVIFFIIINLVF